MGILTEFKRDKSIQHQADFDEIMGNIGLGLLRIGFGKTLTVKIVDDKKILQEKEYSTITKIAAITLFILAFPITSISAGLGCIATLSSNSRDRFFYNLYSQRLLDNQEVVVTLEEVIEEENLAEAKVPNPILKDTPLNKLQIVLYDKTGPAFEKENKELILKVTKHWEKFLNPTPFYLNLLYSMTLSPYYNFFSEISFQTLDIIVYQKPESLTAISQETKVNNIVIDKPSSWTTSVPTITQIYNFFATAKSNVSTLFCKGTANLESISREGKKRTSSFKKDGIDLYPYIKAAHHKIKSGNNTNSSNESSQMSIPPVFAIITQGFVRKLGLNCEQLLKNLTNCYGKELVGKLLVKLGLAQAVTGFVANSFLKMQNPLEWLSTLLSIINASSSLALLAQNNLLKLCNDQVEKNLIKLNSNLIDKREKIEKEIHNKSSLLEKTERDLELINRALSLQTKLNIDDTDGTPKLKISTEGLILELSLEIENLKEELANTPEISLAILALAPTLVKLFETAEGGLKKTFEKTLTSLVADLEVKFKEYKAEKDITNPHTDILLNVLKTIILGSEKDSIINSVIQPNTELLNTTKKSTSIFLQCSNILKKPATFIASYMPPFILGSLNQVADYANQFIGETVAEYGVEFFNDKCLNNSNTLKLFTQDEMQLNLMQNISQLTSLDDEVVFINETITQVINDERGLDLVISSLLENAGIELADSIFKIIEELFQEAIKDENLALIASKVENPTLTKLFDWNFNTPKKSKK